MMNALYAVAYMAFASAAMGNAGGASQPIVCTSKSAIEQWLNNEDRSKLRKTHQCFVMPSDWEVIASDESQPGPALWTVTRPGKPQIQVWTDHHIGDPAD